MFRLLASWSNRLQLLILLSRREHEAGRMKAEMFDKMILSYGRTTKGEQDNE